MTCRKDALRLEIQESQNIECDICGKVIERGYAYLQIDASSNFITQIQCKNCYDAFLEDVTDNGGIYVFEGIGGIVLKNWFANGDLVVSCLDLMEIGRKVKRGK